jgi:hypothetical protein
MDDRIRQLGSEVRAALRCGSFDPQDGEWRASFGVEMRDRALRALAELTSLAEVWEYRAEMYGQATDALMFRANEAEALRHSEATAVDREPARGDRADAVHARGVDRPQDDAR